MLLAEASVHRFALAFVVMSLLLLALQGCGQMQARERADTLANTTNGYRKAIRWGEFELAAQMIRRRDGTTPAYDAELLKNIRVTSYEYVHRNMSGEGNEAELSAALSYYDVENGRVVQIKDTQVWWFDEATGQWYLDGELPDFAAGLSQ
jgi:hypothetical protein